RWYVLQVAARKEQRMGKQHLQKIGPILNLCIASTSGL
ncbi:hypothetical protein NPIL_666241, partial [Nephila pilipes]